MVNEFKTVCPFCSRKLDIESAQIMNSQVAATYTCRGCGRHPCMVVDNKPIFWLDYKNERQKLISDQGQDFKYIHEKMQSTYPLAMVDCDPIIPWLLIKVETGNFEHLTKKARELHLRLVDSAPHFDEDVALINTYKKKYDRLVNAESIEQDACSAHAKAKMQKRRKIAVWSIVSAASLLAISSLAFIFSLMLSKPVLSAEDTGITISVSRNGVALFDKLDLDVFATEMQPNSPEYSIATSLLHEESNKYKIFDIYLTKGGKETQPKNNVTVTIPIDSSFRKENVAIYYIAPDGQYEELVSTLSTINSTISFETNHFSLFAIVEKPYTVSFNTDGGSNINSQKALWGEKITRPADPVKKGHTFNAWVSSSNNVVWDFDNGAISHNEEFLALWTPNTYTLSLDANGGNLDATTVDVVFGTSYELPIPTLEGFDFKGWYHNEECYTDGIWDAENSISLTAKWETTSYKLKFHTYDGIIAKELSLPYKSSHTIDFLPQRTGFTFVAWFAEPECINSVTSINISSQDITLYAKWTANSYSLAFDTNGGTQTYAPSTITFGESYGALPTPTKPGYDFDGWFTALSGGTKVEETNVVAIAENHTLYAQWSSKNISVIFSGYGDSNVIYGNSYGTLPQPSKMGYTFAGWYDAPDKGREITSSTIVDITETHTLYPRFYANSYTIIYNGNEHTDGNLSDSLHIYDVEMQLTANCFSKTGHTFAGWNTKPDGTGTAYTDCALVKNLSDIPDGTITLFAQWLADSCTINYDLNISSILTTPICSEYTAIVNYNSICTLSKPTAKYYKFKGWYTAASGGDQITQSDGVLLTEWNTTETTILYAHWEQEKEDYIYINDQKGMDSIAQGASGKYLIVCDINMNSVDWAPIGNFYGEIDGDNHCIYNFSITKTQNTGSDDIGFIAKNFGVIKNLTIGSLDSKTYDSLYSVKYYATYTESQIESSLNVGGFTGVNQGTISNCFLVNAFISARIDDKNNDKYCYLRIGGISATNYKTITNCTVKNSNIDGLMECATSDSGDDNRGSVGGICSDNHATISSCVSTANILRIDVRGDGKMFNEAYPRAILGNVVALQSSGELSDSHSYDNTSSLNASKGTYTKPTLYAGTIIGINEDGTVKNCKTSKSDHITQTKAGGASTVLTNLVGNGSSTGCSAY